jgi:hypothetical protein
VRGAVDPYLRILAAVALVVVLADAAGLPVLPLYLPAVAVLFAVGGAATASAADGPASGRRALGALLLPFWLFAAAVLAVMLTLGWRADPFQGAEPFTWSTVWLWLVPVSAPPASVDGIPWVLTAWFVPTFLWLTLATPALLWLFRRWPLRVLSLPVLTVLALTTGLATVTGRSREVLLEVCVYACCWLVGFARHDGRLARLSPVPVVLAGTALLAAGLAYAAWRYDVYEAGRIDDIPLSALLCALGAVLLLLRVPWRGERLRGGWPGAVASAVGARTMTVFLWAPAAATAAVPALALSPLAEYHTDDTAGAVLRYAATGVLVVVVVLLVGWAEDVGAGVRPTLLGARRPAPPVPAPAPVPEPRTFEVRGNVVQDDGVREDLVRGLPAAEPVDPRPVGR